MLKVVYTQNWIKQIHLEIETNLHSPNRAILGKNVKIYSSQWNYMVNIC